MFDTFFPKVNIDLANSLGVIIWNDADHPMTKEEIIEAAERSAADGGPTSTETKNMSGARLWEGSVYWRVSWAPGLQGSCPLHAW